MHYLVFALFVAVIAAQDNSGGCDFTDTLPEATFAILVKNITAASFSSGKLEALKTFTTSNNTYGLSSSQVTTLFGLFSFSEDVRSALNLVNKLILTLSVDGLVEIIKTTTFSSEKLNTLDALVNLTNRAYLNANSSQLVDVFIFSSDKDKAREIIAKSCIFPPPDLLRFDYIIDVSGSMGEKFRDTDGTIYTRLEYVQKDLIMEFNIIQFSTSAAAWQRGVVPVNGTNILYASAYVQQFTPGGGTNMLNAFRAAFSDPKVLGVYFLSDGAADDSPSAILSYLISVKKPVNTVAFKADSSAAKFMQKLAQVTGGTFRAIQ